MVKISLKAVGGKSPQLPKYQSSGSSGADIHACLDEPVVIKPGTTALMRTGFSMAVPPGYEAQIRPRSGLALNHGIGLLNAPGTIDSDYRGEVKILMTNFGGEDFTVNHGDRIAQMVITPVERGEFEFRDELPPSERGEGGFGHTGL